MFYIKLVMQTVMFHVFHEDTQSTRAFFSEESALTFLNSREDSDEWDIVDVDLECPFI